MAANDMSWRERAHLIEQEAAVEQLLLSNRRLLTWDCGPVLPAFYIF